MKKAKRLAGLIGENIQGSAAAAMHEQEAEALGFDVTYRLIDFTRPARAPSFLAAMLDAAESLAFAGLNVTHPYKQAILPLLTDLSADARRIGAVNTVLFREGRRIGHNTDWSGFAENVTTHLPDARLDRVALIGAGGAGSAVGYASLALGAQVLTIHDRDDARAHALAANLRTLFSHRTVAVAENATAAMHGADGVIHATPVGMLGHPGLAVPAAALRPEMWVAEVVYVPTETERVRVARACGCRVVTGAGMAVRHAAASFALFFDAEPDVERMLRRFAERL
jgi:shikimate dehydrogenase